MSRRLLSLDDVARILGMTRAEVERLCAIGALPAALQIGSWVIWEDELEKWRRECDETQGMPRTKPPMDDDPM